MVYMNKNTKRTQLNAWKHKLTFYTFWIISQIVAFIWTAFHLHVIIIDVGTAYHDQRILQNLDWQFLYSKWKSLWKDPFVCNGHIKKSFRKKFRKSYIDHHFCQHWGYQRFDNFFIERLPHQYQNSVWCVMCGAICFMS